MEQGGAGRQLVLATLIAVLSTAVSVAAAATPAERASPRAVAGTAWVQRALTLQYELAHDVELRNAPWIGTHNSFNSTAEMGPALSAQDSNQQITIVDQLDAGMRKLELDLHWFPHLQSGGFTVVICHASDEDVGCTTEKTFAVVLDEIAGWLRAPANERQVIQIFLEDDLFSTVEARNEQAYAVAAATIEEKLGDLVYRTGASDCTQMPLDLSRSEQLRSGERVLLVTDGCGLGAAWNGLVHNWRKDPETGRAVEQERQPDGYAEFPECDPQDEPPNPGGESWDPRTYERLFIRYYETSTRLEASTGAAKDRITPQTAAQMARCGVDLVDLDQLEGLADPRLPALVWSWARGEPGRGRCAYQRVGTSQPYGRWYARGCAKRRSVACRVRGDWKVTKRRVTPRRAKAVCRRRGAVFAVPRSGYENQLLRRAMEATGAKRVWLGYRKRHGNWTALDRR
jgi:hypothetical protein